MNLAKSCVYLVNYVLNYILNLSATPLPPFPVSCVRSQDVQVPRASVSFGNVYPTPFLFSLSFHQLYSLKILSLKTAFGGMRLCQFPCNKRAFFFPSRAPCLFCVLPHSGGSDLPYVLKKTVLYFGFPWLAQSCGRYILSPTFKNKNLAGLVMN